MPKVNHTILNWARETSGLTLEESVKKLQIKDAFGIPAVERLNLLELGDEEPSRSLLVRMAKHYRRPLLTFYMSSPPRKGDRGEDFRSLPDDYSKSDDYLIDTLIRNVKARQSMIKAALEDDEEIQPIDFIGAYKISDGLESLLNSLVNTLKLDINKFRSQKNSSDAFTILRNQIQSAGIYVLLIGNLGSYHTSIDVDIFRGFAIADNIAPFIIINDQDSHAAWSFTLIHELVHLLLGQTGISGGRSNLDIERFCNQVTGEFLLPSTEIEEFRVDNSSTIEYLKTNISQFARDRNISSSMVAYKLYQSEKIEYETWNELHTFYRTFWLSERDERRKKARETEGGPTYYTIRQHRLGTHFINLVRSLMTSGSLSTTKAGMVLGIKSKKVQSLFDTIRQSNVAF